MNIQNQWYDMFGYYEEHDPGQQPAPHAPGWETVKDAVLPPGFRSYAEPHYTPNSPASPYGTDELGNALHGPLPFEEYYPDPKRRPSVDTYRGWRDELVKLETVGFQFIAQVSWAFGEFGDLWRVQHTDIITGQQRELTAKVLVPKQFFKSKMSFKEIMATLLTEVTALRGLQHPNVMRIESVLHVKDNDTGFQSLFVFVFYESNDGCLNDTITGTDNHYLDEQQAVYWFRQIADGLLYLHQQGVVHMDIRPDNIIRKQLPGGNFQYKLTDFGLAQTFAQGEPMESSKSYYNARTYFFQPPETRHLAHNLYYPFIEKPVQDLKAMDVYQLAVCLALSLIGYTADIVFYQNMWSFRPGLDYTSWVNDLLVKSGRYAANHPVIDLLLVMGESDPYKRLSMVQVSNHNWVTSANPAGP